MQNNREFHRLWHSDHMARQVPGPATKWATVFSALVGREIAQALCGVNEIAVEEEQGPEPVDPALRTTHSCHSIAIESELLTET